MKKSILLLAAGLITGISSNGQQAVRSSLFQNKTVSPVDAVENSFSNFSAISGASTNPTVYNTPVLNYGERTTATGGRWYSYFDSILALNSAVANIDNIALPIWQDTSSFWGYTGGTTQYAQTAFVGVGLGFNPMASAWNDNLVFTPGMLAVTPSDNYIIDGVRVHGWYNRNNAKPTVVDTLIFQFVQGNGSTGSNIETNTITGTYAGFYSLTSLPWRTMFHDSLNNKAAADDMGTPLTSGMYKFLLNSTDTNGSNSDLNTTYPRPGHSPADPLISYTVSAGNMASMSVSFKSGDPIRPAFPTPDTVRFSSGLGTGHTVTYDYGCFMMNVIHNGTDAIPAFPPYVAGDWTSGYFRKNGTAGWGGYYLPNWAWSGVPSGASKLQYPYIEYHITCATCPTIGAPSLAVGRTDMKTLSVTPNPATDKMTISFTQQAGTTGTITVSNMLGQVVATQQVTNGNAVINTANMPSGLYVYNLNVNGTCAAGRVAIAH